MIRVALLGGGVGSQHLEAYRTVPSFSVDLLVDQNTERRAALCQNGLVGSAELEDALASDVDLIDICLPPHLHAPVAIAALQRDKHVICEKPLATSLADAHAIAEAAQQSNRHVFPVFQYRYGAAGDQLRALRSAGLTGALQGAALETHWARDAEYYAMPWRGTWSGEQGGAVLGHAIHAHDLLEHFGTPIRKVQAMLATRINPIETEDSAALAFALENGALATSSVSLGAAQDETRLRFIYEKLTVTSGTTPYAPTEAQWHFRARDPQDQAAITDVLSTCQTGPTGFAGFLTEVAKALEGKCNSAVTLEDGIRSIALVTAIYAAQRTARAVSLPLSADHTLFNGWQP